jgi:hypothetical protein
VSFNPSTRRQTEIARNKILLLKEIATNPQSRIPETARELGISRSQAYSILKEFSEAWIITEDEPNFPAKLLYLYNENKALPEDLSSSNRSRNSSIKTGCRQG